MPELKLLVSLHGRTDGRTDRPYLLKSLILKNGRYKEHINQNRYCVRITTRDIPPVALINELRHYKKKSNNF